MSSAKKLLEAAAGTAAAGGGSLDVADVFSTYLYKGTGSNQTITNGIDLSGEGGLVWTKARSSKNHALVDTVRGSNKYLESNTTVAQGTAANIVTAFNSNGYTAGNGGYAGDNGTFYASWTFRKAEKFFDVVTYEGNNETAFMVNHNLGVTPGMIILKGADNAGSWYVWHRELTSTSYAVRLNTTAAQSVDSNYEIGLNASATQIYIDTGSDINYQGTYVAYLFAHNDGDGEFGSGGDSDIINCGTFTTDGSGVASVTLGWQPQWIVMKKVSSGENWIIADVMRGIIADGYDAILEPNTSSAENFSFDWINLSATGFTIKQFNANSKYIFTAIRAPMITSPSAASKVFAIDTFGSSGSSVLPSWTSGFPVDMAHYKGTGGGQNNYSLTRLTQGKTLNTDTQSAQASVSEAQFDYNNGYYAQTGVFSAYYSWMWKRAKGYMDVVAYTGTGSARTVAHSLGVVPEMMWVKCRSAADHWHVYHTAITADYYIQLNTTDVPTDSVTIWNDTDPTSSVFTLGTNGGVNGGGATAPTYIAYLFATLAGISKVGSVSHSGSSTDVNCGFSNGARFVLLKRTDAAGDWYYWDSVRGIVAGNDPYNLINSSAAQVTNTDYIDPLSSGFTITGDFTDGTYVFYAIA